MPDDAGGSTNVKKQNKILKLFGHNMLEKVTQQDIMLMLLAVKEKGVIEASTYSMIKNIFEFDDLTAAEVMTHRTDMTAIEDSDPLQDAVDVFIETGYSRIPVYHEDIDNIVGLLYAKDLLRYVCGDIPEGLKLTDIKREAFYVPKTKNCSELFAEMTANKVQLAVVVDEYGGTEGLITMEDLIESIVGNIQDEYDNEEEEIHKVAENKFTVDGATPIDEIEDLVGVKLPETDYDTIAGLMMEYLGRVPTPDEHPSVQIPPLTLTVVTVEERRIAKISIEKQVASAPPQEGKADPRRE